MIILYRYSIKPLLNNNHTNTNNIIKSNLKILMFYQCTNTISLNYIQDSSSFNYHCIIIRLDQSITY